MTFYVLYNSNTLVPTSISGQPHDQIPADMMEAPASNEDGEDFVLFKRDMNHYIVNVVDGVAEFLNRRTIAPYKKYIVPDNVVRDLNYNIIFILNFEITFECIDQALTLTFDLPGLSADRRNTFNTTVNDTNGKCVVYVTEYQDPTALLEKFEVDLFWLSKVKVYTVKLSTNERVSLWAIRKK